MATVNLTMSDDVKTNIYDLIGGEITLRNLVNHFYQIMDSRPDLDALRKMHSDDLSEANSKLFMFLSGWLGGPQLFQEKYGHPRLRARHLPFSIGKQERDQWMICMVQAFDECQIEEPYRSQLLYSLLNLADHMRNKAENETIS